MLTEHTPQADAHDAPANDAHTQDHTKHSTPDNDDHDADEWDQAADNARKSSWKKTAQTQNGYAATCHQADQVPVQPRTGVRWPQQHGTRADGTLSGS
jgi:hypothetical protein